MTGVTEVEIERIAAGGDGVGKLPDGRVVFVPRTAPGDLVLVEVRAHGRRMARARLREVLRPGPSRRAPPCPHYERDECGGCQLQHLEADTQLQAKRQIVGEALRRIGRLSVDDPGIAESHSPWRYRSKITLACRAGRIGFRPYGRPAQVFNLEDCHIASERLMALWRVLAAHRRLLPQRLRSLTLREDRDGGLHVVARGTDTRPWDAQELAEAVGRHDVSYWWHPDRGAARVVWGCVTGFPALAFQQINPVLGDRIRRDAVAALGDISGRVVWDLFGGVGDTAMLLAERGATVWSVDADRAAIQWAERRLAGLTAGAIRFVNGLAEEAVRRLPEPEAVVANPPRQGLESSLTTRLERWAARHRGRVVYVSCDPATLARDLGRMPAMRLIHVQAYDLFPQTSHVEVLAVLEAA